MNCPHAKRVWVDVGHHNLIVLIHQPRYNGCLYRGSLRYRIIRVDRCLRLPAKICLNVLTHQRNAGRTSDQQYFVKLTGRNAAVRKYYLYRLMCALHQVLNQFLKLCSRYDFVHRTGHIILHDQYWQLYRIFLLCAQRNLTAQRLVAHACHCI